MQSRGRRGPVAQYLQGVPHGTHSHTATHTHTRGIVTHGTGTAAQGGGDVPAGGPRRPLWHTRHWEAGGKDGGCLHLSRRVPGGPGGAHRGESAAGVTAPGASPPAHSGRTESGGHAGTQPNKLEVGWEGGRGRREGSEPVGGALDERHFAELHHGRAGLVLHAGHPLQQLLRLALRVPQLLPPLHQLGVALWGREPGQDWGQRGWASPGCQVTFSVLMSWHGLKGRANGQQWDG